MTKRGSSLQPGLPPEEYLDRLIAQELFPDGLRFVAGWLPKPDAVRWACHCVQGLLGEQLTDGEKRAFDAALCWAAEPTEENRRAAEAAAEKNQFNGPASWLALGAFWSGGSLAPPELPEAPAPEGLTSQALAAALVLASGAGGSAPHQRPLPGVSPAGPGIGSRHGAIAGQHPDANRLTPI